MTREGLEARLGYRVDDDMFGVLELLPAEAAAVFDASMNDTVKMLFPILVSLDQLEFAFEFPAPTVWCFTKESTRLTLFLEPDTLAVNFQVAETPDMLDFTLNNYGRLQLHTWFSDVFDCTL